MIFQKSTSDFLLMNTQRWSFFAVGIIVVGVVRLGSTCSVFHSFLALWVLKPRRWYQENMSDGSTFSIEYVLFPQTFFPKQFSVVVPNSLSALLSVAVSGSPEVSLHLSLIPIMSHSASVMVSGRLYLLCFASHCLSPIMCLPFVIVSYHFVSQSVQFFPIIWKILILS